MNLPFSKQQVHLYLDDRTLKIVTASGKGNDKTITGAYFRDISGLEGVGLVEQVLSGMKSVRAASKKVNFIISSSSSI